MNDEKLLFIGNIAGKDGVNSFAFASISAAKKNDMQYYLAANYKLTPGEKLAKDAIDYGISLCHIDFYRNPFNPKNYYAYKQLLRLIKEEKIDYIHCNTPIGGILGRIAGKKCKVKKIIYQAHGFHFYKGAPKLNWLLYYPVEKWLAHYTDALITINQEDYELAKNRFKLRKNGKVYYVPGVGIDISKYQLKESFDRSKKRSELGLTPNDIAVISAGDLIKRKNYETSIRVISKANNSSIHYFICGNGPLRPELESIVRDCNIENNVHFLGYRTDVKELLWASDIFLFTTRQEGLPRSLSEAMACGLPCIASNIRGNVDLIEQGVNGFLYDLDDIDGFANGLKKLAGDNKLCKRMGKKSLEILQSFSFDSVVSSIVELYKIELV